MSQTTENTELLLRIEHLEQLNKFLSEQKEMAEIRLKQQIGMHKMILDFFTMQNKSIDAKEGSQEEKFVQQQRTKDLFIDFVIVQNQQMQEILNKLDTL